MFPRATNIGIEPQMLWRFCHFLDRKFPQTKSLGAINCRIKRASKKTNNITIVNKSVASSMVTHQLRKLAYESIIVAVGLRICASHCL